MGAWTLEFAKERLMDWLNAELAVTTGQGYQIGSQRLERANLYQVREQIKFWRDEVEKLELAKSRRGKVRTMRAVPRDL